MSSAVHYIEVPCARNSSTSTLSSAFTPSDTHLARSPSDIQPTIVILDESVLDPGKHSSRFVPTSRNMNSCFCSSSEVSINSTKSESAPTKNPTESKSSNILGNDPVLDPNKAHSVLRTASSEQMSKSSIGSGNYSPSARIPDGQTDDPDDYSSCARDVAGDYSSDEYGTEDLSDAEVSDNVAEYTPSNSCTDGYLASGFESDEEACSSLRNAVSRSSTLSGHHNKSRKVKQRDNVKRTEDFAEDALNKGTKIRPKTAVHRKTNRKQANDNCVRPKTAACQARKDSLPAVRSLTTKEHKGKCMNKQQQKDRKFHKTHRKGQLESPRRKKHPIHNPTISSLSGGNSGTFRKTQHYRGKRPASALEFRKCSRYKTRPESGRQSERKFQRKVGGKFVNLVEDVVTQMSLLGDSDNDDLGHSPISKEKTKTRRKAKRGKTGGDSQKNSARETNWTSPCNPPGSSGCRSKLLLEQLFKWKNDYMRGLSMYIEDQLKQFDRSNSLTWNTLSNEGVSKRRETIKPSGKQNRLADPERKSCHICEKKPVSMQKLRSIWNRPGTASKSGNVLLKLLIPSDRIPPLGSETDKAYLRKAVKQRLKGLHLPRSFIKVYAASDIKLVCHMGQLIMVGEGATGIAILGHLKSEKTFVVVKMYKLPYAGGKTSEILDQSVLAGHVNKTDATPKFHGLVALDHQEATVVGVHDVAMAFKFIGHTPSCAVTTLSTLCEKASTSQMYRDPDADTSTCQLNAVVIVKNIITAMNKVHYANLVMPGLDVCKVLLCEEEGVTRPYLSSRLHPLKDRCLAWPTVSYLGLKNSKPTSYSQKQETEVPPEAVRRGYFNIKSDVFQLGKLMLHVAQAFNIPHLQYLARRCLRQDPLHRPDIPRIQSEVEKIASEYQNHHQ